MKAPVVGVCSLQGLAMEVSGEQGSDSPIPFEVVEAPLHCGGHRADLELNQFSFEVVTHAPDAIKVPGALAALPNGSRHHDVVHQVQH